MLAPFIEANKKYYQHSSSESPDKIGAAVSQITYNKHSNR